MSIASRETPAGPFLCVPNYDQFQHYKKRNPPWIKLYNSVLDDYAFTRLSDANKFHLMAIWLLASRTDNCIPADAVWISRRINADEPVDIEGLIAAGFLQLHQGPSRPLADCKHDASKVLVSAEERRGEQRPIQGEYNSEPIDITQYRAGGADG